jgi:hypothetical protein
MVMVRKMLWVGMPIGEILTIALRERPTHPMCSVRTQMEIIFARYVGPRDGYAYRWYSIWVPKSLVANARGPITQWAPKPKN